MKRINCVYLLFTIIVLLSGCVAAMPPLAPETVQINLGNEPYVKKIAKYDFGKNAVTKEQVEEFTMKTLSNNGYYKIENVNYCENSNCSLREIHGINSSITKDGINFYYYRVDPLSNNRTSGKAYESAITTTLPVEYAENDSHFIVKVYPPTFLEKKPARNIFGIIVNYYYTEEDIKKDIIVRLKMFKENDMSRIYLYEGEFNSAYNSDSVYANFERILGKYPRSSDQVKFDDIEKRNAFKYNFKGGDLPLYVSVFPYRNGSKIVCKLSVPYLLGESISISNTDIDTIKSNLEKIVSN